MNNKDIKIDKYEVQATTNNGLSWFVESSWHSLNGAREDKIIKEQENNLTPYLPRKNYRIRHIVGIEETVV